MGKLRSESLRDGRPLNYIDTKNIPLSRHYNNLERYFRFTNNLLKIQVNGKNGIKTEQKEYLICERTLSKCKRTKMERVFVLDNMIAHFNRQTKNVYPHHNRIIIKRPKEL